MRWIVQFVEKNIGNLRAIVYDCCARKTPRVVRGGEGNEMALRKCKDCGSQVSKSAKACPNCGRPAPTGGTVPAGCLVIVLIAGGCIWLTMLMGDGDSTPTAEVDRTPTAQEVARQAESKAAEDKAAKAEAARRKRLVDNYETTLRKLVADGAIHSVDDRVMRIDPLIWSQLDVDAKRSLIEGFYNYHAMRGKEWTVRILSSRSDDELAVCGPFSGSTIRK